MDIRSIQTELNKTWLDATPWACESLQPMAQSLIGLYRVTLEATKNDLAPHKLLVHGTDTNIMSMYHSVIHSLYAVHNGQLAMTSFAETLAFAELRRRILVVESHAQFKKPIFQSEFPIESQIHPLKTKGSLWFYKIHCDIAAQSQLITHTFCLNFRDDLIGAELR